MGKIVTLLLTAFLLNACISATTLSSNQAKEVDQKIEKVFVILDNPAELRFFKHFQKDLLLEFLDARVTTKIFDKTLITMETEEDIEAKIDFFEPSHLIKVSPHSDKRAIVDFADTGIGSEVRTGGMFYIEIIQNNNQKVIWKGLLNTDEYLSLRTAANKSARKIVRDLKERDLIAP